MKHARRSVSDADIVRYESFSKTLQQQRGLAQSKFKFPDQAAQVASIPTIGDNKVIVPPAAGDEDDLYG
uniref:Histone-fold-containing protein n=1 Tax=Steinernema glaseri TaxID=37863 RepID=A0A1I7ZX39_9BILA